MAIAGRSYANVPIIIRGSLENPTDFGSKTARIVVTPGPAGAYLAVPPPLTARNTLQDPPVLTTAPPVVLSNAPDARWFIGSTLISMNPQPQVVAPITPAPQPIVVAQQPATLGSSQVTIFRSTLQDPLVLTTAQPLIIAAPIDSRWLSVTPAAVLFSPQAPVIITSSTPAPVVVVPPTLAQLPSQAFATRSTLQDPPVLTTVAPYIVAGPTDPRWFKSPTAFITSNPQTPVVAPPVATLGPVVVSAQPGMPGTARAYVTRNTLQDPPVLTTMPPLVVTPRADIRWMTVTQALIASNPQTQAIVAMPTPGPLVIAAPTDPRWNAVTTAFVLSNPQWLALGSTPTPVVNVTPTLFPQATQAQILRNIVQDPITSTSISVLVVVAAPTDSRWLSVTQAAVRANPMAQIITPVSAAPAPVVVVTPPSNPQVYPARTVRNTLQDPLVLTTPQPLIVVSQVDFRWLAHVPVMLMRPAWAVPYTPPPAGAYNTLVTCTCASYVALKSSASSTIVAGVPIQGNMRQLALDRWNYMYPS
jgi:hypothetical protein